MHFVRSIMIISLLIPFVFIATSCSDSSTNNDEDLSDAPQLNIKQVELPAGLKESTDPYAQAAVSYVILANSTVAYSAWWTPPANAETLAKIGESTEADWTYTWTVSGFTVKLEIEEFADHYEWRTIYSGSNGGVNLDNFLFIETQNDKDGENGQMKVYDPATNSASGEWIWATNSSDVYSIEHKSYSDNTMNGHVLVNSNPDLSGTVQFYDETVVTWKADWTASGAGEWWSYSTEGNPLGSGSWD